MTKSNLSPFAHFQVFVEEMENFGTGGDTDTLATGDATRQFRIADYDSVEDARAAAIRWAVSEKMHRDGTFARVLYFENEKSSGKLVWDSEQGTVA